MGSSRVVAVSSGCILKVMETQFASRSDVGCERVIRTSVLNTGKDCFQQV